VWGTTGAATGIGVYGDGAGIGVFGATTNTTAVAGITSAGGFGIYGASSGIAGYFDQVNGAGGNVFVAGSLTVLGIKSAAVKDSTGSLRRLYCEESPESYFSDYGEGQYRNGRGFVRLDNDFGDVVHKDNYQVFLTEYGANNGLYVSSRTAAGFEIRCSDGSSSGSFGYRVVAKRKDVVGARLYPTLRRSAAVSAEAGQAA